jgi:hypothetical protein
MPTSTTNYTFQLPTVGADDDLWGGFLNGNWTDLDTLLFSGTIGASTTGNATTATTATTATSAIALATARTINGVSFDGTANITLPTVNDTGDQNVAGVKTFTTALAVTGTSKAAGQFYAGTTNPTNTTRVNYDGALHATSFVGNGSGLTNLPSSAPTTAQVGAATAGLAAGAVGSYAALSSDEGITRTPGHTRAGSGLRYIAFNGSNSGIAPSGTWQLMGYSLAGGFSAQSGSVWLRIS